MSISANIKQFSLVIFLLLSACGSGSNTTTNSQIVETSNDGSSYTEAVHINNCGGKADSEQTVSKAFTTEIDGAITVQIGYKIVEGNISAKYGQYRNDIRSQRVVAPPGTNMEVTLKWSENVRAGNVTIDGVSGTYKVRIPISVEQIASKDLGCDWQGSVITAQNPPNTPVIETSQLIINGAAYSLPSTTNPYCVAQEVNTGMKVVKSYDVSVPDGWVMMWSSWKAKWPGGNYNENGLLIIRGPWQGTLSIDTGGSCSGPIQWYDFILDNRRKDYPVPSRPEYTIP
jgi:hypothetical protein